MVSWLLRPPCPMCRGRRLLFSQTGGANGREWNWRAWSRLARWLANPRQGSSTILLLGFPPWKRSNLQPVTNCQRYRRPEAKCWRIWKLPVSPHRARTVWRLCYDLYKKSFSIPQRRLLRHQARRLGDQETCPPHRFEPPPRAQPLKHNKTK